MSPCVVKRSQESLPSPLGGEGRGEGRSVNPFRPSPQPSPRWERSTCYCRDVESSHLERQHFRVSLCYR